MAKKKEKIKKVKSSPPEKPLSAKITGSDLVYLVNTLLSVEKMRVAAQVRLSHFKHAGKNCIETENAHKRLQDTEDYITLRLKSFVQSHPAYPWFTLVRGIGNENIAKVIGLIDIKRAPYISSLWKWFGYYPGAKREKGKKLEFNIQGKSMCWRMAGGLLKGKGKFYDFYLLRKKMFTARCISEGLEIKPQAQIKEKDTNVISEGHVHNYALRKMIKLFLACLWLVWREAEGLPLNEPYSIGIQKHSKAHFISPWDMIDKPVKSPKNPKKRKHATKKK